MSDKILRDFIDILKAVPCKEEPLPPFKMPKNHDAFNTELVPRLNRKRLKHNKRL